jgi:organic radical activating enzyme
MVISSSFLDYPSPSGIAVVVYFPGCDFKCPECQNEELQEFTYLPVFEALLHDIEDHAKRSNTKKIVFSGGDPLSKSNQTFACKLAEVLKERKYEICIYTGNTKEELGSIRYKLKFDYIKCGRYENNHAQKSEKLDYAMTLASTNQKMYDNSWSCISESGIVVFDRE